jgi:hypothetical protein
MKFTTLALVGAVAAAPVAEPQWGGLSSLFGGGSTPAASSSSGGLGGLASLFGGGGSSSGGAGGLASLFGGSGGGSADSSVIVGGYNKIKDRVTEMGSFLATLGPNPSRSDISRLESLNKGQIEALRSLASAAQGMSG